MSPGELRGTPGGFGSPGQRLLPQNPGPGAQNVPGERGCPWTGKAGPRDNPDISAGSAELLLRCLIDGETLWYQNTIKGSAVPELSGPRRAAGRDQGREGRRRRAAAAASKDLGAGGLALSLSLSLPRARPALGDSASVTAQGSAPARPSAPGRGERSHTHPLPLCAIPNVSSLDLQVILLSVPPAKYEGVVTSMSGTLPIYKAISQP